MEAVGAVPSREEGARGTGSAYVVPEGGVLDGVLGGQGDAAEQDEEEDQVGEDRVVDDAVALEAKPAWGGGEKRSVGKAGRRQPGPQNPRPSSQRGRCSPVWGGTFSLKASRCRAGTAWPRPHHGPRLHRTLPFERPFTDGDLLTF